MGDSASTTVHWPRGVTDPLCPQGHPLPESLDRRLLWHLDNVLAVSATTDTQHEVRRKLRKYLYETCDHHWHLDVGYADMPPVDQCLWCNDVRDGEHRG